MCCVPVCVWWSDAWKDVPLSSKATDSNKRRALAATSRAVTGRAVTVGAGLAITVAANLPAANAVAAAAIHAQVSHDDAPFDVILMMNRHGDLGVLAADNVVPFPLTDADRSTLQRAVLGSLDVPVTGLPDAELLEPGAVRPAELAPRDADYLLHVYKAPFGRPWANTATTEGVEVRCIPVFLCSSISEDHQDILRYIINDLLNPSL